ncbi:MAG: M20/M25/M40 family metallo-hydrolase [Bacteroidales bacterium]|nr:M20/M25/M40 family metallo-hydrolase [Bacteroidales bacterium]
MKKISLLLTGLVLIYSCNIDNLKNASDEQLIKQIFEEAHTSSKSYNDLKYLTENFPKRLACYPQGIEAAKWTKEIMEDMALDKVFLQEAHVMNWERGNIEKGAIKLNGKTINVNVCALGRGIATEVNGLEAKVIEVNGLADLNNFSRDQISGNIIFFNEPMNPENKNTFQAYGKAAGQRFAGPVLAAEYGAVGVVIRSLTTAIDTFPHTGTTRKAEDNETVPSICIATKHANLLSEMLKENPELTFYFETNCKNLPDTISYNAIGELTGTDFPDEYIVVGGHLDSWDNGPGAHDDGGGCMQSIEVLRIFQKIGYKPRHSIRAVMYMDEEISQGGGKAYAEQARINNEKHIFAIESDRGVTRPLGFSIDASQEKIDKIVAWSKLFEPYDIDVFVKGGSGVDIDPLKDLGTPLSGLLTDPEHYFDWHHSGNDTFDHIVKEDMQNGAAAMAALIYLVDKYGLE